MPDRIELSSTGFAQRVPDGGIYKVPPFDPRTGDHYWVLPMVHHIINPERWHTPGEDGPGVLDLESLVQVDTIGCYHCERPWSKRLASRRCKGSP